MTLADYFASLLRRRWQPGILDCGVFMADWVRELTGHDPIADVRGTYSTEKQFLRIVRAEGGFEASCAARLIAAGARETETPQAGNIMTVRAPYKVRRGKVMMRPTGAICAGPDAHAVMTSDLGLVIAGNDRLPMMKAWTFHG